MKTECKNLRYILYARKSTDTEDKQVQSLDDQKKYMTEMARREGLHIVKVIEESRSAKKPFARPKFYEMIEIVEKGKADGIICWAMNRLSRNPTDSGRIQQLLQDEDIKHILTHDRSYYPEDNALILSVESRMSNQYIRELSAGAKRGMKSKAEKGDKPGPAPIGYLNDRATKTIIVDSVRFPLIRNLWDKMLTGTYSISQLAKMADEELHIMSPVRGKHGGKPIAYSSLCALFKNRFYTGALPFNGQIYKGNHPPMVSEEEFERVQQIIDPSHTTRPKDKKKEFLLRDLFRCGRCGFAITIEEKHKYIKSTKSEAHYIYCHCTGKSKDIKCDQPSLCVREEELIEQIKDKLSRYTISPNFFDLAIRALREEEDEVVAKDTAITTNREQRINKVKQGIANLRRMRYMGEADDDSWYFSELESLEKELESLQGDRNKAEKQARDWRKVANDTFMFARYAKEDFDNDDWEKKRTVIMKLGEKLTILDRTIQFTPNKYFIPIEKMNESLAQQKELVRTNDLQGSYGSKQLQNTMWLPVYNTLRNEGCHYEMAKMTAVKALFSEVP